MFLIPAMHSGGAERQLLELVKGLDKQRFAVTLAAFNDDGALRREAENLTGVSVVWLQKRGRWDVLPFLTRLWRAAWTFQPDVILGYMNLACDLALLVGRPAGAKVAWSLRASNVDYARYGWGMLWSFRVGAWLSNRADLIILNSWAGRQYHAAHGYCAAKMLVIPNGIDTRRFHPDGQARQQLRAQWRLGEHETAIGLVGRVDVMKDHPTFLQAAAALARERADVRFVCIGAGSNGYAAEMQALGTRLGLGDRLLWTGAVSDMPAAYNALDLLTSASSGEGFSNAVGEGMACGTPCIVTDVGDSARIVGKTGLVVPPKDPAALAQAWRNWLNLASSERQARGRQARARIEGEFGLELMVTRTEEALERLILPAQRSQRSFGAVNGKR